MMIRKTIINESICVAGCLIAAFLLFWFVADSSALDINMHDTYLRGSLFGTNLSSTYLVFNYFLLMGLWAYLFRALYFNFKVIQTDVILLIFTGLVLFFLSDIIFVIHPPVLKPPVIENAVPIKGLFYGGSYSNSYLWGICMIKISLMLVLAFTAFMIGRKWPKSIVK